MIWQYSPYTIPFLAGGCITLILAATGWRNRTYTCARPFALLMLAVTVWSFGAALEVSSAELPAQMLAILLQYPGIVTVPVAWLLFAFEYSGREHWITKLNILLLSIVPAITLFMVATNPYNLYYISVTDQIVGGLSYADIVYGPFFWFNTIYAYLIIYVAIMIILQRFVFSAGLYRGQMVAILIAVFTPFFVNIAHAVREINFLVIDPTPLAFIISGFAVLIGMVRYQLLDITPMAQDQVIANMHDGMIVIDAQDRIISTNSPVEHIFSISARNVIGLPVSTIISIDFCQEGPDSAVAQMPEIVRQVERTINGKQSWFELRCNPILTGDGDIKGRIIMIRDITNQKLAEAALTLARKKISLLSSITRHDILNQVTVLLLNIDTLKDSVRDPALLELIRVQESAVENIRHQIEFARDYETLGGRAPAWMSIHEIFTNILPVMGSYAITFVPLQEDIEIFADPLLERVFYNLVDNSIRHGGKVSTISVRCAKNPDGIMILYEDNGTGVPVEMKEKIFDKGVGKHTGLGLFLAKEILEITGLSIRETGVPGIGVRFEISVPRGQYRLRS